MRSAIVSLVRLFADPMIAVLLVVSLAALLFPVTGEAREHVRALSNLGIFVLFLVNGMRISRAQMRKALGAWRFFAPLLTWVFGVMTLAGLGLSELARLTLPVPLALGFLFLGTLPSTVQSAASYTSLAHGNIALSVAAAAIVNIAGVFISAPLFALLAGSHVADVGWEAIERIGLLLVAPFVIGQIVQARTRHWVERRRAMLRWIDRLVIALAVYVALSAAVSQGLLEMLDGRGWAALIALVSLFLAAAHLGAWAAAGVLGFDRPSRIAFLFAAAQKSVAIGAPLAAILFPARLAGFAIAPLMLYHLLQLVIAAPIALHLAKGKTASPPGDCGAPTRRS